MVRLEKRAQDVQSLSRRRIMMAVQRATHQQRDVRNVEVRGSIPLCSTTLSLGNDGDLRFCASSPSPAFARTGPEPAPSCTRKACTARAVRSGGVPHDRGLSWARKETDHGDEEAGA